MYGGAGRDVGWAKSQGGRVATQAKSQNIIDAMRSIVIFRELSPVESFKLRFAFLISIIPVVSALIPFSLILVFSKLNLYYLEGNGVLIDPQVRTAYYDQVITEVLPLLGYFGVLLLLSVPIGWIVMNWVTYPFVVAENSLKKVLESGERVSVNSSWQTESADFDETVQAYITSVVGKENPKKLQEPVIRYSLNYKFLFKFVAVFLPLSLISSLALRILIESVYGKIVSLALNLLHGRTIQSHYILAQQEVLEDAQRIMFIVSLLAYALFGRFLSHHISTMIYVFTRAMRESKFPIRLRPTDIYHQLAETLNSLHAKR